MATPSLLIPARRAFLGTLTLIGLAFLQPSCHKSPEPLASSNGPTGAPKVYVTNYPLQYFTQRLAGSWADIHFPAPKDIDPAFWQPTDDEIAAFQKAGLIVMNGATYSKWAEKVSLPEAKVVNTSAAFKSQFIEIKNEVTHSHGKEGMHSHNGTAFTTWVDFDQARQQAEALAAALQKLAPSRASDIAKNLEALKKDLVDLDTRMIAVGKKLAAQPIAASHPVYHYWARRYQINLQFVHWEPEEVPTEAQMDDLKKLLSTHPAKWFVWEGEPAKESVTKIKALGLTSVVFDPCANTPDKGDWLEVMKDNVKGMESVQ